MCINRIITLEWSLTEEAKKTRELFRPSTTARVLGGARLTEKALKRPKKDVLVSCIAAAIFIDQNNNIFSVWPLKMFLFFWSFRPVAFLLYLSTLHIYRATKDSWHHELDTCFCNDMCPKFCVFPPLWPTCLTTNEACSSQKKYNIWLFY